MGLVFPPSTGRVNMRGLILLLPALLVLFLAPGSARTEEGSSLVGDADLPSNILPLGEKVEVREAREARRDDREKTKKKKKKKNKEAAKKEEEKKKGGERKKSRKLQRRKDTKKAKKEKEKEESKEKKKKKEEARRKKKLAKKRRNKLRKSAARQAAGGDWSSCGTSGVNDTCLLNAVNSLNFEKNQIQNFFKQKARLENQNKVTGNKKGKKGEFEDAAGYMLTAIGGNISSPTCGENSTRSARAAADAVSTYNTLINCSATIHEACDMPNDTINATFNANCANIYILSKIASDDCRSNSAYTNNGSAACNCWEKAAIGITIAKAEGCTKKGKEQAQAVKKQKNKCIAAFSTCKKAEDAAVALIHTCMSGEVNTNASSAEKDLTSGRLIF